MSAEDETTTWRAPTSFEDLVGAINGGKRIKVDGKDDLVMSIVGAGAAQKVELRWLHDNAIYMGIDSRFFDSVSTRIEIAS